MDLRSTLNAVGKAIPHSVREGDGVYAKKDVANVCATLFNFVSTGMKIVQVVTTVN
jgi:hypothetical protein